MKSCFALILGFLFTVITPGVVFAETVWLDDLNLASASQGWGEPQKNKSVDGHKLTIGGKEFARGFGTHADSIFRVNLDGDAQSFSASVGVDDEVNMSPLSSVEFVVHGDGKVLWKSGVMGAGEAAKICMVNLAGVKSLVLEVDAAGGDITLDHADWADAKFETTAGKPVAAPGEPKPKPVAPYILTPIAPSTPRINGANVFGVRPGSPFLFTIPATGDRPMAFSAEHLPQGLTLDANTGRVTGTLNSKDEYIVTLRAKNSLGTAEKKFRIVCGDRIALTPPMGWNSWNCFAGMVSAEKVKRAADALVKSGLINHGWTYINIDDYWENHRDSKDPTLQGAFRDDQGNIVPNSRFPDMKGLADYVHSLGLKIGLYSSPGPWTCGGCVGSFDHEQQDAAKYAQWGFDYLKYDWCSYSPTMESERTHPVNFPSSADSTNGTKANEFASLIRPYAIMHQALTAQKRDIVFSFSCGGANVWEWGDQAGGNCWRTTGDIIDTWRRMSDIGFKQDIAAPFAKPGNWNDPDMLIIGQVGWGTPHPTCLTPDEQYTHISLWCLLSAPLLIGCDMEKFDNFTLNLLSNDEVLALDQDELGKQATCVITNGDVRIYKKELKDGGHAIGFFNLGANPFKLDFNQFAELGLAGKQTVRDLWRQKDVTTVDTANETLPITIPGHGVVLYKLSAEK
jgi:alpha-galactosidase